MVASGLIRACLVLILLATPLTIRAEPANVPSAGAIELPEENPGAILPSSELPAPNANPVQVINEAIAEGYSIYEVSPAESIDDVRFLRRVMLDIAGRTPTLSETLRFRESNDPKKRETLVDQLLSGPEYAFHLRNELDRILLAPRRSKSEFRSYLLWAIQTDRRWPTLFTDMILPTKEGSKETPVVKDGAGEFLGDRVSSIDDMTNDVSRLFFGVSINCAKCHDHPLVADWVQGNFYGMAAFFHRTYRTRSGFLAEKHRGELSFQTVEGQKQPAEFLFLSGARLIEPAREWSKDEIKAHDEEIKQLQKNDKLPAPGLPAFSPRSQFIKLAMNKQNEPWLARNLVNRTWARLLGTGIVDPVDQVHSGNPASHPELLDWLTRDLMEHNYDLRRLIRAIVLSDVYALDSEWPHDSDPPGTHTFAVAPTRVMSPWQYALSLDMATRSASYDLSALSKEEQLKEREQIEKSAEGFSRDIELPGSNYQVSVDEALLFANDRKADHFLRDSGDRVLGDLKSVTDLDQVTETLFLSALSRLPGEEEQRYFRDYLSRRSDRPTEARRQVLWSLLTSPEMRFNY